MLEIHIGKQSHYLQHFQEKCVQHGVLRSKLKVAKDGRPFLMSRAMKVLKKDAFTFGMDVNH